MVVNGGLRSSIHWNNLEAYDERLVSAIFLFRLTDPEKAEEMGFSSRKDIQYIYGL